MRRRRFMTSNKFDGSNYMTIEALEDITVRVNKSGYLYTLDGHTWNGLPSYYDIQLQNGEKCYFKAHFGQGDYIGRFIVDGRFHLGGNCMSLLFGDDAKNKKDLTGYLSCFSYLFSENQGLISVDSDFLPATTLSDSCYDEMFYNCTNLTTAPTLPATTLVPGCYYGMYRQCNSLNYIKALFTTTPGSSYTWLWVSGVSPTGTFIKNPDATWDVVGSEGVPSGWTVKFDGEQDKKTENYLRKGNTSMTMQVLTLDFPAETDLYVYYTTSMIGSGMLIWPKGHSIHSLGLGPGDSIVSVDRIEPNEDDFYIYKIAY